jgi:signal transduction histidine kinase
MGQGYGLLRRLAHARLLAGLIYGLVALCSLAQAAAPQPLRVAPEAERQAVWPALRMAPPEAQPLTPQQAAALAAGPDAIAIDSPEHVLGRGTLPHWARFSLDNPSSNELPRLLTVETTTQFDIRLFIRDEAGLWQPVASLADATGRRIGGGTTYPAWELELPAQRSTELLLRMEGPSVIRFPVFLYHPSSFAEQERKIHVAIGVALGCCLFIGIYVGSLRRYLDDRSLPLFIAMLIGDLLGALWLSGFLSEFLPAWSEQSLTSIGFAAYALLFGSGGLHARIYLNTAAWSARTDRLLQALGGLWFAIALWFPLAFPVTARIVLVWGGSAMAILLVVVAALAARRKTPFSAFIAAAWVAYLLIGLAFLFARVVDDPHIWPFGTLALLQATLVAALFGLAMSQRMLRQRDALLVAHHKALLQNEQAAALMRERSLLFAATNHDLRQPLAGVNVFAELLKSARTAAEQAEYAQKLSGALKEVDDFLVGMQQLAAINEAAHQPTLSTVCLDDVLRPLVDDYRNRAKNKRIAIRYVPSHLMICTDVPYFQRIVRNLLANAIRYTSPGDRVLIGCRRGGGRRLVIADTGQGMSEAQAQHAFAAFQRFDAGMSSGDGFGLGLYSTKSLANALGLSISLRSRQGRGTEFSIGL